MTVAPIMPMATTSMPAWRKLGCTSAWPISRKSGWVCGKHENLDAVADADGRHEDRDHRLDHSHAQSLQGQQQQHVEGGDDNRPRHRDVEQQVQGDRAAQRFGQVGRADGDFHGDPVRPAGPARVQSRQHWARSLPVATPSRAEMT